jgi:hypothetical protein
MTILKDLAVDISLALQMGLRDTGMNTICELVSNAVKKTDFVRTYLSDRAVGQDVREVLYEDEELGFCICGHVYADAAIGSPHDHGSSWAIYGQAEGETDMSEWTVVAEKSDGTKLVSKTSSYTMKAGDVRFYDIGVVHSPHRTDPVRLLRVEGENLDNIRRSDIEVVDE